MQNRDGRGICPWWDFGLRLRRHLPRYNGGVPFTIRDFRPADFETLWRIDQTCFAPGIAYSRRELTFYMQRRGAFTLIAMNGRAGAVVRSVSLEASDSTASEDSVAGFIVAEADRGSGHIITIDVIAAARRAGVGSLLLQSAEGRLERSRCSLVELETAVDNVSALSFYKRHGYSVVATAPRYYSNGLDALVLQKGLSATR